jgi:hypothetical protein
MGPPGPVFALLLLLRGWFHLVARSVEQRTWRRPRYDAACPYPMTYAVIGHVGGALYYSPRQGASCRLLTHAACQSLHDAGCGGPFLWSGALRSAGHWPGYAEPPPVDGVRWSPSLLVGRGGALPLLVGLLGLTRSSFSLTKTHNG